MLQGPPPHELAIGSDAELHEALREVRPPRMIVQSHVLGSMMCIVLAILLQWCKRDGRHALIVSNSGSETAFSICLTGSSHTMLDLCAAADDDAGAAAAEGRLQASPFCYLQPRF